jgi:WD40 repeat protein
VFAELMIHRTSVRTGHAAAIYALRPAADGLYSAAADGYLVHWHREDVDLGRVVATVEGGKFLSFAVTDSGLVAGTLDGGVHWLYPDRPDRNRHWATHRRGTFAVCRVGEEELYTAGGDGVLVRWSVPEARSRESFPLSANSLRCIAYDPVHDRLAVGASDGYIYLLSRDGRLIDRQFAHSPSVFTTVFSRDGRVLFAGGRDAHLSSWSVTESGLQANIRLPAHLMTVNALALHPEGHLLASASRDKTVKLWDAHSLDLLKVCEVVRDRGHVNSVNTLCWLDGNTLATAGDDRRVLEWGGRLVRRGL